MKGRTLIRVGATWLAILVIVAATLTFMVPFMANQFLGLGVEVPGWSRWFSPRIAVSIFLALGYAILLGWIPFLLIGVIKLVRERRIAAGPDRKDSLA